jgi:hypothetical protein
MKGDESEFKNTIGYLNSRDMKDVKISNGDLHPDVLASGSGVL